MDKFLLRIPLFGALISVATAASPAPAENPQPATERRAEQRAELQQRLRELDSPCYETRRLAAERVERWLAMPEMSALLAEQLQQLSVQPELSFEVRWRISSWRNRLPPAKCPPPQSVPAEELERLARQLDDDSYAVRAGAGERLQWMAASEHLAPPIMLILNRRLADPLLSEDSYRRVESIRHIVWGAWLGSDAAGWNPAPVSAAQIDDWLDELGRPAANGNAHAATRRRIARQALMDVLTQDREAAAGEGGHRSPPSRQAGARGFPPAARASGPHAARIGGGMLERPPAGVPAAYRCGTTGAIPRRLASHPLRSRRRLRGPLRERKRADAGRLSCGRRLPAAQCPRKSLSTRQSSHAAATDRLFLLCENRPGGPAGKAQPPYARPVAGEEEFAERLRIGDARPT